MSFVWKRLQRVNKRAVKYRVLFELRELVVEGCSKWQPNKLVVVFTRRSRRRSSQPMFWEPTIRNPYLGSVQWNLPEIIDIEVTLFKDSHNKFESKEWTLTIEDIPQIGKPRRVASMAINISDFVDKEQFSVPSRHECLKMKLKITSKKVKMAHITFMMCTQFLKEGKATDDDMQSLASLMSLPGPDPAPDLDDDDNIQIVDHSDQTNNEISQLVKDFNQFIEGVENDTKNISTGNHEEQDDRLSTTNDKQGIISNEQKTNGGQLKVDVESNFSNTQNLESDCSSLNLELTNEKHTTDINEKEITVIENINDEKPSPMLEFNKKLVDSKLNKVSSENLFDLSASSEKCVESAQSSINYEQGQKESNVENEELPKTPSQYSAAEDILNWCQEITKDYNGLRITNMTTSWRNGIAFGAIIHHFRPDLIDFDSLQPYDIVGNCKKVFDAAASLGIPKLIDPQDMIILNVPDKLSVMTYLYQMRSYFTGKMAVEHASNSNSDSYTSVDDVVDTDKKMAENIEASSLFSKFNGLYNSLSNDDFHDEEPIDKNDINQNGLIKKPVRFVKKKESMDRFDSDSDEEFEIIKKPGFTTQFSEKLSPHKKGPTPIRKPLRFNKENQKTDNIHVSQSAYSFKTFDRLDPSTIPAESLTRNNNIHYNQVAPGLWDLSSYSQSNDNLKRTNSVPNCQNHSLSSRTKIPSLREVELRERVRKLLENVKKDTEPKKRILSQQEEERLNRLRQQARKLIADARQGITNPQSSLSSHSNTGSANTPLMLSPSESYSSHLEKEEPLQETEDNNNYDENDDDEDYSVTNSNEDQIETDESNPVAKVVEFDFYKFKANENKNDEFKIPDNISPIKNEKLNNNQQSVAKILAVEESRSKDEKGEYIDFPATYESLQEELSIIEKDQKKIDQEASILEKRLRKLMESGGDKNLEEKLIQNWFILVNKRNAIIRRQMQLNILEKEADMNRRYEELNSELRNLMLIEDLDKTDEQSMREKQLLDELVKIVDKRNELVQHLDNQERAIEEDEFVESQTQCPTKTMIGEADDKNCSIQ